MVFTTMEENQTAGQGQFQIGNQFWKNRSSHGREKLFSNPQELWTAATEYFEWVDAHPWYKVEQLKKPVVLKDKDGNQTLQATVELPTARPYTLNGLCLYLDASREWWTKFKAKNKTNTDFLPVITRIEEIIYTQKFEGATVGAFNANIISRDLGLAEKVDAVVTDRKRPDWLTQQNNEPES